MQVNGAVLRTSSRLDLRHVLCFSNTPHLRSRSLSDFASRWPKGHQKVKLLSCYAAENTEVTEKLCVSSDKIVWLSALGGLQPRRRSKACSVAAQPQMYVQKCLPALSGNG